VLKIEMNFSGRLQDSASAVNSSIRVDGTSITELIPFHTIIKSSYLPLSNCKTVAGNAVAKIGAETSNWPSKAFRLSEEIAEILNKSQLGG
jgi:hypothetical protein